MTRRHDQVVRLVWPGRERAEAQGRAYQRPAVSLRTVERYARPPGSRSGASDTTGEAKGDRSPPRLRRLLHGDSLLAVRALLPELEGQVDLVYLDPPFATGDEFRIRIPVGEGQVDPKGSGRSIEETAFRDRWGDGLEGWLDTMLPLLAGARSLLADHGSLYLHCDHRVAFHAKVLMDELFGADRFVNQIVWHYSGWNRHNKAHFNRRHDQILVYTRGDKPLFASLSEPWSSKEEYVKVRKQKVRINDEGREYVLSDAGGGRRVRRFLDEAMAHGRPLDDVWSLDKLNNSSRESAGYPTQKPLALLRRVVEASSAPGGVVLDLFCGSGTTLVAAEDLGRGWVGCDLSGRAIEVSRRRVLGRVGKAVPEPAVRPVSGETAAPSGPPDEPPVELQRVEGCRRPDLLLELLEAYGATPLADRSGPCGVKGPALVQAFGPGSEVTGRIIAEGTAEAVDKGCSELHLLAFDWSPEIAVELVDQARKGGVIPVLVGVPPGAPWLAGPPGTKVGFFELPHPKASCSEGRSQTLTVRLELVEYPSGALLPPQLQPLSDPLELVELWGVDLDFDGATFTYDWLGLRTGRGRTLPLVTPALDRPSSRTGRPAIKVVDVLGAEVIRLL